jgi:transcriptional regulator with XRE-family HTH domain
MIEKRLKQLREGKGLSRRGLAKKAGVVHSVISTCERGEHSPRLENLAKIADALGVGVSELLQEGKG